jgi:hypothetical protein
MPICGRGGDEDEDDDNSRPRRLKIANCASWYWYAMLIAICRCEIVVDFPLARAMGKHSFGIDLYQACKSLRRSCRVVL